MKHNVLITGGCGFIGKSLARLLVDNGHQVRVVDNFSVGTMDDLSAMVDTSLGGELAWSDTVQVVEADIQDADAMVAAAAGATGIVHLAANTGVAPSVEDPRADCLNNVIGTLNMLEAARAANCTRFVFASSGAPVGECEPPIHEEKVAKPVSPYGASKLAGEAYCSAYARTFGIDTVGLRFGNVYGPGSTHKSSVVAKFIRGIMDGEVLEIYGDGTQTRDFIYLLDLIQAILQGLTVDNIGGEIFQIATNRETTVSEVAELLVGIAVEEGLTRPEIKFSAPRLGDVMRNYSDTTKAKERLGWQAETSLDQGIRNTIQYFVNL